MKTKTNKQNKKKTQWKKNQQAQQEDTANHKPAQPQATREETNNHMEPKRAYAHSLSHSVKSEIDTKKNMPHFRYHPSLIVTISWLVTVNNPY